ncbi:hypothetical protein [Spirillospora sp. NPDC029432]|uniref:hypothetical protein n=1 Tax=Spirillospora sp. NPDC029432 TaxID=3154599 RepID=UPI003455E404
MTTADRAAAIRAPTSRNASAIPGRAAHAPEHIPSSSDTVRHPPAVVPVAPPAPAPQSVQRARAYLTARHATGVHEVLWESRKRSMPDREAIDAVITAGDRAQRGIGESPEAVEIAAALVVLSAVRLNLDQAEGRLLNIARASGMGSEQVAAVLDISVDEAEERHRRLEPRLAAPAATTSPVASPRDTATQRPRGPARDQPAWDELDDEDWGR